MTRTEVKLKIIKVPLAEETKFVDRPQIFPRMHRLYLELLENKDKIKQSLVNKEYVPKDQGDRSKYAQSINEMVNSVSRDSKSSTSSPSSIDTPRIKEVNSKNDSIPESAPKRQRYARSGDNRRELEREEKEKREEIEREEREEKEDREKQERRERENRDDKNDKEREEKEEKGDEDDKERDRDRDKEIEKNNDDELETRLMQFLANDSDVESDKDVSSDYGRSDHTSPSIVESYKSLMRSRKATPYKRPPERIPTKAPDLSRPHHVPPGLKELEQKGHYQMKREMPDVTHVTYDEQEDNEKKRELLFKFQLLSKSYPKSKEQLPKFTLESNLDEMKRSYDSSLKMLSIDSKVDEYKTYLIGGFMLTEFVLGNFFGLDMQGFTQQQILSMNSYEKLLIELGERSYVPSGKKWPVEIRLLIMIVINAAFFVVGKLIMKKTGANLINMVNSFRNSSSSSSAPPATTRRKNGKMKGPSISISDLPDSSNLKNDANTTTNAGSQK